MLPDRKDLVMTAPALSEYARWVVRASHVRGLHAIGGMAADVPNKRDPDATLRALDAVRRDKKREAECGHDGTWVAHPGLVDVAREAFDSVLCGRVEQRNVMPSGRELNIDVLTGGFSGRVTSEGILDAVRSVVVYTDSWLRGIGCVAMAGKMEDAATAEISRALLWHWVSRREVSLDEVIRVVRGEVAALAAAGTEPRREAVELLLKSTAAEKLPEFITTEAYDIITKDIQT